MCCDRVSVLENYPMPEGWYFEEDPRTLIERWTREVMLSPTRKRFVAEIRSNGAGWRWYVWFVPGNKHVRSGWNQYLLECAEEVDELLPALVAQFHMGVL